MPKFPVMSAQDAYEYVLKNVGANIPKRDIVDQRIVENVRTGKAYYDQSADTIDFYQFKHRRLPKDSYKKGIITDIRQIGGYPEYKGESYVDTDKDGMPDAWEKKYGLNPNDASDNGDALIAFDIIRNLFSASTFVVVSIIIPPIRIDPSAAVNRNFWVRKVRSLPNRSTIFSSTERDPSAKTDSSSSRHFCFVFSVMYDPIFSPCRMLPKRLSIVSFW